MPQTINTNMASLNAQRNLNTSQSSLATSLQRLSSGQRINSAKDDAAGLAITQRFTAQINGLNQAARNANDGISLAQTAEGDLGQIGNNLQRLRELAVQSANGTNSVTDRAALNQESQQLIAEIDRVAQQSKFNGVSLLDGTFNNQQFQVGADAGQTISISAISSARTSALGAYYSASVTSSAVNNAAISGGNVTLNGVAVIDTVSDGVSTTAATASAKAKATAINSTSAAGVTATAVTNIAGAAQTAGTGGDGGKITINGVQTALITLSGTAATDRAATVSAINAISAATGVIATDTGATGTGITMQAADGRNVVVSYTATTGTFTATETGAASGTNYGTLTLTANGTTGITAGGTVAIIGSPTTTAAAKTGVAVSAIDLTTVTGANAAIASIDAALSSINSTRASLGAVQNRFASVVSSLQTTSENLSASRSRIQDADFAAETANLTRNQVLQQAGVAMLAQANALPNQVLSLLKG